MEKKTTIELCCEVLARCGRAKHLCNHLTANGQEKVASLSKKGGDVREELRLLIQKDREKSKATSEEHKEKVKVK